MADTESPEGLELVGEHGGEEERDVWGNTHVARAVLNTLATRSQAPVRSRVSQPHRGAAPSSHPLGYGVVWCHICPVLDAGEDARMNNILGMCFSVFSTSPRSGLLMLQSNPTRIRNVL